MGSVSDNSEPDDRKLELFAREDLPPPTVRQGIVDPTFRRSKEDGYPVWTQNKAKLISNYVRYFLMVTKHGTYLDGFAGPQVEEYVDDSWSAKRVLEVRPPWMRRFILCDKATSQVDRLRDLQTARRAEGDNRKIEIHQGDFNEIVDGILGSQTIGQKEATFCLLDQRTFECKWDTVRKIAKYKSGSTKIEQFYFLAVGWLQRSISGLKEEQTLIDWWGDTNVSVVKAQGSPALARLFQHKFERELGYASALAWPIYERPDNGHGKVMYFMIHATDHSAAPLLMNRAYKSATSVHEPMSHSQTEFMGEGFDLGIADKYGAAVKS